MDNFKKIFVGKSKKVWLTIFILIAVSLVVSISGQITPQKNTPNIGNSSEPVDPAVLEANKKALAELKTKFNYKYDEFEKKGWYEAKTQVVAKTFDKNILRVNVNNVGYAYLSDQYYSDDWIFHTRVEVKIGETIYKSENIPTYDSNNSTSNSSGSVWESISYTADRDNGIIKAIAESGDQPIKVRFTGGNLVYDFTLTDRDRLAIRDSYNLSELIKKTGDTGVGQTNSNTATKTDTLTIQPVNKNIIQDLGAISVNGNIRNHRLVLVIDYKKAGGTYLSINNYSLPISADVKIYKLSYLDNTQKELIFSKSGSSEKINITSNSLPEIIINPKEINMSGLDSKNNSLLVEVTVHTPQQGSFSATDKILGDELNSLKYTCSSIESCQ